MLSHGTEHLEAVAASTPAGTAAAEVVSGDLNGDGYPDSVVAATTPSISVYLSNPDGSLQLVAADSTATASRTWRSPMITTFPVEGDGPSF